MAIWSSIAWWLSLLRPKMIWKMNVLKLMIKENYSGLRTTWAQLRGGVPRTGSAGEVLLWPSAPWGVTRTKRNINSGLMASTEFLSELCWLFPLMCLIYFWIWLLCCCQDELKEKTALTEKSDEDKKKDEGKKFKEHFMMSVRCRRDKSKIKTCL